MAEPEVRITLRLPESLRDKLDASASEASRSMNGEIVERLDSSYERAAETEAYILALRESERRLTDTIGDLSSSRAKLEKSVAELRIKNADLERDLAQKDALADSLGEKVARLEHVMTHISDWRKAAETLTFAIDSTGRGSNWKETLEYVGSFVDQTNMRILRIECVNFDLQDFISEDSSTDREAALLEKILRMRADRAK